MDIFKFNQPGTQEVYLKHATLINGIKSVMWVERYRDPCEFKIVAPVSSGIREILELGSFISHVNTFEVMVVESHEILDNEAGESEITITGRSLEVLLEQRVVGAHQEFPLDPGLELAEYGLTENVTWEQCLQLVREHAIEGYVIDENDAFIGLRIGHQVVLGVGEEIYRPVKRGILHKRLLEIMEVDNLGIRSERPNPLSPFEMEPDVVGIFIHKGTDRTRQVNFSYTDGDFGNAQYLWSKKKEKNAALVTGKWLETMWADSAYSGADRRVMMIDASELDESYSDPPTDPERSEIIGKMETLARQTLAAQRSVAIAKVEIEPNSDRYMYRRDYQVGDLVGVDGEFDTQAVMKVTEYVEIEDETGERGYPTLSGLD